MPRLTPAQARFMQQCRAPGGCSATETYGPACRLVELGLLARVLRRTGNPVYRPTVPMGLLWLDEHPVDKADEPNTGAKSEDGEGPGIPTKVSL